MVLSLEFEDRNLTELENFPTAHRNQDKVIHTCPRSNIRRSAKQFGRDCDSCRNPKVPVLVEGTFDFNQIGVTFVAHGPFLPWPTSN